MCCCEHACVHIVGMCIVCVHTANMCTHVYCGQENVYMKRRPYGRNCGCMLWLGHMWAQHPGGERERSQKGHAQ